jgi:hypothetical protein
MYTMGLDHGSMEVGTDKPDKYKPWRRINEEFKEEKKETRSHTPLIYTLHSSHYSYSHESPALG